MNSFRGFVQRHLSRGSLHALLVVGVVALAFAGQGFVANVDAIFAEVERTSTPDSFATVHLGELRPPLPTVPPPKEVPNRSLAFGESSQDVLMLQTFLAWRGYWPSEEPLSGYFGTTTLDVVKKYQIQNNLEPEGIVGPLTREEWRRDVENF